MTTAREWPNRAKNARDNTAKRAVAGIKALQPILTGKLPQEEIVRRVAIGTENMQHIARMMEAVGARSTAIDDGFLKEI